MDKKIELANKLSDILIYGHVAINEKIHKIVMDRHGATKPLLKLRLLYQNLVLAWSVKRITQECPEFTKELSAKLEEAMTLKPKKTLTDCFEKIMDTMHLAKTIASCHHRSSVAISLSEIFAMVVLAENNEGERALIFSPTTKKQFCLYRINTSPLFGRCRIAIVLSRCCFGQRTKRIRKNEPNDTSI